MQQKYRIDEEQVRKAIALYVEPGACFELRLISKLKKFILHGYFQDADTAIRELKKQDLSAFTCTISLNRIMDAKMATDGRNGFVIGSATQDKEVEGYANLLIDFDPKRPSGISSTEEERHAAYEAAVRCHEYLKAKGFALPVVTMSGNGFHLLYAVKIKNDEAGAGRALIDRFLKAIDILFSNSKVDVDTGNGNQSRVLKLPGTWAVKGSDTEDRPHRLARIISAPEGFRERINDVDLLRQVVEEIQVPEEEQRKQKKIRKTRANTTASDGAPDFDLLKWLDEKIPDVMYDVEDFDGGKKVILEHCLFDDSHEGKDACFLWFDSGAIVYKCFHNSCAEKTWGDVIDKYDPSLRTRLAQAYREKNQMPDRNSESFQKVRAASKHEPPKNAPLTVDDFMQRVTTPEEIRKTPRTPRVRYRTGFQPLDDELKGGLQVGGITVVTGYSGSCKTTFISNMILNQLNDGRKIFLVSGELTDFQVQDWMDVMSAGPGFVGGIEKLIDVTEDPRAAIREYAVREEIKPFITQWQQGKLFLYRNRFGYDFRSLAETVRMAITELKVDLVFVDNLMCLTVDLNNDAKWAAQGAFCWQMHELAQETGTHIVLCAHPKKPSFDHMLSQYDVSGNADIANSADNVVIVHRVNDFFQMMYRRQYRTDYMPVSQEALAGGAKMPGNAVKLEKSRYGVASDVYIPLWYDPRCMRLTCSEAEIKRPKRFGWEDLVTTMLAPNPFLQGKEAG